MGRNSGLLLATALVLFALFPLAVLFVAASLPDHVFGLSGIPPAAFRHLGALRVGLLFDPDNAELWASLWRTTAIALSVSATTSTLGIVAAYLVTRQHSRRWRKGTQFFALAAYGLPSVFLLMAFRPLLIALPLAPLARVWILQCLYILPMSSILTLGYAASHPHILDRSAAIDGAHWRSRFWLAYRANLWRGHLAVTCIGILVSWGDIIFSQQMLPTRSKLLVDLYVLRYFDTDSTFPDYSSAALFALVLTLIAAVLALFIAVTNRRGA
jgi:ABC-type glycerol-3-phosphate transport system permease component